MPLVPGKSKKAFSKNVEIEMNSGKPQKQALAIAYSVKRKKKMAEGGKVDESAKSEHRPMPEEQDKDSQDVAQNRHKKQLVNSDWDQNPGIKRPKTQPIKHPSMAQSPVFKVKLRDQEDHLEDSASVNNGPQHKKYAEGGEINEEVSMHDAEEDGVQHPAHLEEDNDEMAPPEDEFMAGHFADGGEVEEERHNSIAAAIMARRDRMHDEIDSGAHDLDHAVKMAEGGEVDLSQNADEEPNHEDQMSFEALKKENYNESEGLDKLDQPRDSNLKGDSREEDEENKHDMVSSIRSKMNAKRQFPR